MRIKRIEAATVAEAMRRLREDLGDNALILQTRTITAPGVAGLFRRTRVEILGAVDAEVATAPGQMSGNPGRDVTPVADAIPFASMNGLTARLPSGRRRP